MHEVKIPSGVKVTVLDDGSEVSISGKLGSTIKIVNMSLMRVRLEGDKLVVEETKHKKLAKKAGLATTALTSELQSAIKGVENGIEKKMRIVYAHFPMSIEVKGDMLFAKNVFGEKKPRTAKIVGSTKVEIKGQDVFVRGVDPYDVGQTVANINKLSFVRHKDSRVFQDGIYPIAEE